MLAQMPIAKFCCRKHYSRSTSVRTRKIQLSVCLGVFSGELNIIIVLPKRQSGSTGRKDIVLTAHPGLYCRMVRHKTHTSLTARPIMQKARPIFLCFSIFEGSNQRQMVKKMELLHSVFVLGSPNHAISFTGVVEITGSGLQTLNL